MTLLRPQIIDARGKRLALLAPLGAEQRRRRREIQRRLDRTRIWTRRHVAIAALVFLPVMLSGLIIPTILILGLPKWLVFAAAVPVGLLPAATCLLMDQRMFTRCYRDAYIGAGMCPSCGYDLAAAAVEVDQSRVCPECGGAWRVA